MAALFVSRVWSIECGSAHDVDVKASNADNITLKEGIVCYPVGSLARRIDMSLRIDTNNDMQQTRTNEPSV